MAGWIKLHRSMLDWEWYDDVNVCRLFTHCLLRANHKTKSWRGKTIERGQFWTSLDTLSAETKLSKKQIRVALAKLESTGEVANQGHATGRMVTIVNYDSYQEEGTQGADQGQTKGTQGAANKNVNNEKNEKNKDLSSGDDHNKPVINCPHDEIVKLYMKILPELPGVKVITEERKRALRATWRSHKNFQTLEFWEMYFNQVKNVDWIMGRTGTTYAIDFTYLVKQKNVLGIVEGKH
tara:strand:- start:289 stop:999 length:711 start_codon:yes stop_codon:yes gene_type:complete